MPKTVKPWHSNTSVHTNPKGCVRCQERDKKPDHVPHDELVGRIRKYQWVVGQYFRHRNTWASYYTCGLAFNESTMELHVQYEANNVRWSRPVEEFLERFVQYRPTTPPPKKEPDE